MSRKVRMTFKLSQPLMILGKEKNEIDVYEPTVEDIIECGQLQDLASVLVRKDLEMKLDMRAAALYIERLCDLMPNDVKRLDTRDFIMLANAIAAFLLGGSEKRTLLTGS